MPFRERKNCKMSRIGGGADEFSFECKFELLMRHLNRDISRKLDINLEFRREDSLET